MSILKKLTNKSLDKQLYVTFIPKREGKPYSLDIIKKGFLHESQLMIVMDVIFIRRNHKTGVLFVIIIFIRSHAVFFTLLKFCLFISNVDHGGRRCHYFVTKLYPKISIKL